MDLQTFQHERSRLFVEKTAVEISALAILAVVYLLIAPGLVNGQRDLAVAPLAEGQWLTLLMMDVVLLLAAVVCGALLGVARPEGVLVAALAAAAGLSVYSPPMRTLLWEHSANVSGLYVELLLEVLGGGICMVIAAVIAESVWSKARPLVGRRAWRSPLDIVISEEGDKLKGDGAMLARQPGYRLSPTLASLGWAARSLFGRQPAVETRLGRLRARGELQRRAACAGVTVIIAVVLLSLLMRSTDRKQVLFAVFVGFLVAGLISRLLFPTACSIVIWIAPVVVGAGAYAMAAFTTGSLGRSSIDWLQAPHLALALPIDWIAVGGCGAVLGAWLAARHNENKLLEENVELD